MEKDDKDIVVVFAGAPVPYHVGFAASPAHVLHHVFFEVLHFSKVFFHFK